MGSGLVTGKCPRPPRLGIAYPPGWFHCPGDIPWLRPPGNTPGSHQIREIRLIFQGDAPPSGPWRMPQPGCGSGSTSDFSTWYSWYSMIETTVRFVVIAAARVSGLAGPGRENRSDGSASSSARMNPMIFWSEEYAPWTYGAYYHYHGELYSLATAESLTRKLPNEK